MLGEEGSDGISRSSTSDETMNSSETDDAGAPGYKPSRSPSQTWLEHSLRKCFDGQSSRSLQSVPSFNAFLREVDRQGGDSPPDLVPAADLGSPGVATFQVAGGADEGESTESDGNPGAAAPNNGDCIPGQGLNRVCESISTNGDQSLNSPLIVKRHNNHSVKETNENHVEFEFGDRVNEFVQRNFINSHNSEDDLTENIEEIDEYNADDTLKTHAKSLRSTRRFSSIDSGFTGVKILVLYCGGTIGMRCTSGVYKPEPNFLVPELRKQPLFHDPSYALRYSKHEFEQPLVLPLSKEGKRIIYCIYEYEPLLDSSNMTYDDYGRLANDIHENYHRFDGFVILHGTDTMAYTASALSFMLENLGKPVVLTGSQIPIFEQRSDGRDNFLSALVIAGHYAIPEVTILFDNKLLRGNRSKKIDASGLDAFGCSNISPLAVLEINIHVQWDIVFRHRGLHKFAVHTNMCPHVGVLRFFPSITKSTVQAFLRPPMQGVVLETYGSGNGPTARSDLLEVLREATERGVIIVNITQCARGSVSPLYEVGKILQDVGVIAGCDMTVEAALMKLSYVLSKDWDLDKKRQMMKVNMRGEMTVVRTHEEHSLLEYSLIGKMVQTMRLSSPEEIQVLRDSVFPPLLCSAAREGNNDALEKLRLAGAVFNMADYDGRTPLHVACCEGHYTTVKYLLEFGAPVHIRDRFGHSPLDDAIRFNQHDIIELLKVSGAHLRLPAAKLGMLMCNSVLHEPIDNMKSWLVAGANVNQGDYDGRTALHLAVAHDNKELVEYLLSAGADHLHGDSCGKTPMDEARNRGLTEMVELLSKCHIVNGAASGRNRKNSKTTGE